eukprot:TRINITY_DN110094_c0_g1_i1.p1 TRINITY_DN110094_c0_g1~~TRINITY_DN110094_c0_g1_i1.p1  ORF type:complete len:234 (+),score=51.19 TRINITY_DN110094_c0_g1_i1:25-726(+)
MQANMVAEQTETKAVPVEQIQNCKRLSAVEQENSALYRNIAEKGGHAYYFAHQRQYDIPADAKIITGPGLVAGGAPQRLSGPESDSASGYGAATLVDSSSADVGELAAEVSATAEADQAASAAEELRRNCVVPDPFIALKEYSWADEGEKVKVYIQCDGLPAGATESLVSATFDTKSLQLEVATVPCRRFKLVNLSKEIVPEECKVKLNAEKGRITLTLKKKRTGSWFDLGSS